MTQQEEIIEELKPILGLVFENKFGEIKRILKSGDSFLHVTGLAIMRTILAAITMDKSKYRLAKETAWKAIEKTNEERKKGAGFIFRSDANEFTDDECHAELVHSELLAIYGFLCVIEDQSLMGFVKAAFRVRSCYIGLKECERILNGKTNWKSEVLRHEFSSGVHMDLGLFEMGISFMPRKFMILLELAGYSGNRSFGLDRLELAADFELSHRRLAAMIALVAYHMFAEYFFGLGEARQDLLIKYISFSQTLYPNSGYATLIQGLMDNVKGNFPSAIQSYEVIISDPDTPRGMMYILFYLCAWLSAMMCDWVKAMQYSKQLKNECKWSRSLFTFMYAIFAAEVFKTTKDPELHESMIKALIDVPLVKRNFGGKKAFHEKIVIEKAAIYVNQPEKMILPQLDLMYLWNLFIQASHHPSSLVKIRLMIEQELKSIDEHKDSDLFAYLTFMKGCTHAAAQNDALALNCFHSVITLQDSISDLYKYLVPQAHFEIAMVYRRSGDVPESKKWFKSARKFTGYLTETMITFRSDCALKSFDDTEKAGRGRSDSKS